MDIFLNEKFLSLLVLEMTGRKCYPKNRKNICHSVGTSGYIKKMLLFGGKNMIFPTEFIINVIINLSQMSLPGEIGIRCTA